MGEKIRATVAVEKNASNGYDWVITAVEGDIGSMPRIERSTTSFTSEADAKAAAERRIEEMRID